MVRAKPILAFLQVFDLYSRWCWPPTSACETVRRLPERLDSGATAGVGSIVVVLEAESIEVDKMSLGTRCRFDSACAKGWSLG